MNDSFKKLDGKIKSNNKNFSVYGGQTSLSDALKIANEFHKEKNKKFKENFLSKTEKNNEDNKNQKITQSHPTFELSDDELRKRIEIAKNRNEFALMNLNESSSLNEILSSVIDDLIDDINTLN